MNDLEKAMLCEYYLSKAMELFTPGTLRYIDNLYPWCQRLRDTADEMQIEMAKRIRVEKTRKKRPMLKAVTEHRSARHR